ncbi:MAG: hypothetical protein Q9214_003366 [Letrouitia sp. 1 TL-2023]
MKAADRQIERSKLHLAQGKEIAALKPWQNDVSLDGGEATFNRLNQSNKQFGTRIFYGVGTAAVAGGLYYIYQMPGDAGSAELRFQKLAEEVTAAGRKIRLEREEAQRKAQTEGEELVKKAGAQIDKTADSLRSSVNEANAKLGSGLNQAGQKLDQLTDEGSKKVNSAYDQASKAYQDTSKQVNETADSFDKTVNKKASEAKGGISSWLGFGGK